MIYRDITISNFQNEKRVSMLIQAMRIMTNFTILLETKLKIQKNHRNQARSYMSSSGGSQVDGLPPVCYTI